MAPRIVGRLTAAQVRNAKHEVLLCDGGNLHLQVTVGKEGHARKSWVFRYELDGRRHEMGLGGLNTRSLKSARDEAKRLRLLLLNGDDPLTERRTEKERKRRERQELAARKTFRECSETFLTLHADGLGRNAKHRWQWRSTLASTYPVLGDLFVGDVDTPHIIQVLEPLWNTRRVTARRLLGRIERVLGFATAAGYRRGENPARWRSHLRDLLPSNGSNVQHHAALPYAEIGTFMVELRAIDTLAARALEFTILTAARAGETLDAPWDEFNLDTWTVPATRMKAGREHRVPLSSRAVEILRDIKHPGDRPFAVGKVTMRDLMRRMRPGYTTHGFRSAFMDWAHEQTAFPKAVIDLALAHAIGDKVEAAYRRGDLFRKRRQLMEAWAEYCSKPAAGAVVTPIRKAGAHA
jgi:integrase